MKDDPRLRRPLTNGYMPPGSSGSDQSVSTVFDTGLTLSTEPTTAAVRAEPSETTRD